MAYDEGLAERIREIVQDQEQVTERKMFGGLAFMVRGNMFCGIVKDDLMLRLGKDGAAEALEEPHTRDMDFTGRPMKSMVFVEPPGYESDAGLEKWVKRGLEHALTLKAK